MSARGEAAYAKHVAAQLRPGQFKPWEKLSQSLRDRFDAMAKPKQTPKVKKKTKAKKAKGKG